MQFRIDNASNRPVYRQIIDQVKRDIALGKLIKGEKLATVRELAAQLVINPNTTAEIHDIQLLKLSMNCTSVFISISPKMIAISGDKPAQYQSAHHNYRY